jgi:hypothetical protein
MVATDGQHRRDAGCQVGQLIEALAQAGRGLLLAAVAPKEGLQPLPANRLAGQQDVGRQRAPCGCAA